MSRIHALWAAFGVFVAAAVLATPAAGFPIPRPASDHTLTTAHFAVHYFTDPLSADYSTEAQAGDIAAYAEQAYALERSWGYPAPADDGDGLIDIYLESLGGTTGPIGFASPDGASPYPSPDSGAIVLATPTDLQDFADAEKLTLAQEEQKSIAHELFHLVQFATWTSNNQGDYWLFEGSAQWAGFSAIGNPTGSVVTTVGPADLALTCRDDLAGHQMCDPDPYVDGGYARWAFFQLLANKYGNSFLQSVFANGAGGQSAVDALTNAIAAEGGSLADAFTDYSVALMTGNFGVPALSSVRPSAFANVIGGTTTETLAPVSVPVNHLSTRYVTFQRGDGDGSHPCYAATLSITVTVPSGTASRPYFFWDDAKSTPVSLSINGNTATTTVPWDTCAWGTRRGWLSLPNASTTVDAAAFTVASSVTVDPNTPAAAASAPTGPTIWGTTVPVPTTDVAPLIDVFGPELLKLSANDPTIRLIVSSSGVGSVNATLGAATLGSRPLRAGNNDLRFVVPKRLFTTLRSAANAGRVLMLTPLSTSGAVEGRPVTRRVSIAKAPKAAKPKTHTK
jgi:hypothetical protein